MPEPWLDRRQLAGYLSVSVRQVDYWRDDGMPEWLLGGRAKFKISEVERWLAGRGLLRRVRAADTVAPTIEAGAAPRERPAPRPPRE
jgi:hypothetical protein